MSPVSSDAGEPKEQPGRCIKDLSLKMALLESQDLPIKGLGKIRSLTEELAGEFDTAENSHFRDAATLMSAMFKQIVSEESGLFSTLSEVVNIYKVFSEAFESQLQGRPDLSELEKSLENFKNTSTAVGEIVFPVLTPEKEVSAELKEPVIQTLSDEVDVGILASFITEGGDEIETAETNMLKLEETPADKELINLVFRSLHSLKGTAAFLQLKEIGTLSHQTEDLLSQFRDGVITPTADSFNAVLCSIDTLKNLFNQLRNLLEGSEPVPVDIDTASRLIQASLTSKEDILNASEKEHEALARDDRDKSTFIGEILKEQGAISEEELNSALLEQQKPIGQILLEHGATSVEEVDQALHKQKKLLDKTKVDEIIKIPAPKVDEISELIGEMVVALSLLSQHISVRNNGGGRETFERIDQLEKITEALYERILDMRMFPVSNVFTKLTRQVRDLSQKLKKQIDLVVEGGETLVDKTVIDGIYSPLMHIVRNAIDHGIESGEDRVKVGKPPAGQVRLFARHLGDSIEICVQDDGKGLQKEAILEKAISRGLIRETEKLKEEDIFALIFEPGFSTVEKTTDISGRGVGMDVVKQGVETLLGKVSIKSTPGKGTSFNIELPLKTSIIEGLIVRVGDTRFVLSILDVDSTVTPRKEEVKGAQGKEGEFFLLSGRLVPVIKLSDFYHINADKNDPAESIMIVVSRGRRKYGLMVDDLMHRQQVVIKNLGDRFSGLTGITGGTILGDGRIGLILNPEELIQANGSS